ncbi:MAG: transposase, partial [Verrucomicrobia bacterium]|nr:transposase [Verrucomicrobiota bacterium]
MLKQPTPTLHKTTRTEITPLFGEAKLVLDETPKAISPFGGLASFISFLGQIGFAREVQQHLPFAEPASNNAIPLAHSLTAFLMSVVVGARRFAHCEWLRADRVLHAMLGLARFPSDDTIRNFFLRFGQADIEAFWRPLWRWLLRLVRCPVTGFSLDLDSTVFCREGQQEGARKGFNPRRKGRNSHHPLLAVLAEAPFILHGWLRSGNTGPARGVIPFLQEALALLPEGTWLRTVRADSGFFDGHFLDFLEARRLPYVVVARMTSTLKRHCAGIKDWTVIDEHHAAGEFTVQLFGWSKARRFVVVRER